MSSLEKFAKFAQPDKILMVGEVSIFFTSPQIISTDFRRHLLGQIPLLKQGTLTLHLVLGGHWMDSLFPNVTQLGIWLVHW